MSHSSNNKEDYVAVRIGFQASAVVNGTAVVWVPLSVADKIECGAGLDEAVAAALLDADAVEWEEEADLGCLDTTAIMDSCELVDAEDECCPAFQCCLSEDGKWHVMESTEDDDLEDDDEG